MKIPASAFSVLLVLGCHPPYPDTAGGSDTDDTANPADSGDTAGTEPAPPEVAFLAPSASGAMFWESSEYDFEVEAEDPDGDLQEVSFTHDAAEAPTAMTGTGGQKYALRTGLPLSATTLTAQAMDAGGRTGKADLEVEVLDCSDFEPQVRWTFDTRSGSQIPADGETSVPGTVYDASGLAEPVLTQGIYDEALDLTGSTTYVQAEMPGDRGSADFHTLAFWARFTGTGDDVPIFTLNGSYITLVLYTGTATLTVLGTEYGADAVIDRLYDALSDGGWHHLALGTGDDGVTLYVDGQEAWSRNVSLSYDPLEETTFELGTDDTRSDWFEGQVDDLFVVPAALDTADFSDVVNSVNGFCGGW